ncbi:urate hydroxylase PuuD [Chloroflexales bacterium ZM16-3]|nr:urate hydroxylase PuuD [Chloroflexales bacterium ZM16-3]
MEFNIRDWIDLLVRWTHVIAGIMWIGNSMLFNWLDRNLVQSDWPREGEQGKIWLLHSGAFYEVEKKLLPRGARYPDKVHWFMFQNLTTWVSGIFLLAVVYYLGGAAYMIDPSVAQISPPVAIAIGVATLVGGWFVYDLLWRSPLGKNTPLAFAISFALLIGIAFGLSQVLSGRAAYIHIGALMGTLMTGNVWLYIVPSQRGLVAATKAGLAQDAALSYGAKQRSIHNNYMTFPVLFIMISNHYPITYSNQLGWLVLAVLMVGSALVRHFMNIRFTYGPWLRWAAGAGIVALALAMILTARPARTPSASAAEPVSFAAVQSVIQRRCVACHSAHPTDSIFTVAPVGVMFDTPEQIEAMATRINERAVVLRTMPFNNQTGISDTERDLLGRWYDQGATITP